MNRLLDGKRAIVTGSTSGVGAAIARALASDGAAVLIHGRDVGRAESVAAELRGSGERAASITADLTQPGAAERVVTAAVEAWGGLDIFINSAAVFVWRKFLELSAQDWERTIATNLSAPFHLTQAAARAMVRQGTGGSIVNIGSIHSFTAEGELAAHCSSKFGLIGLTQAAAAALREHDIRVNAICPGAIDPVSSSRRGESPRQKVTQADVATLAVFLCSDLSRSMTGSAIPAYGVTRTVIKV